MGMICSTVSVFVVSLQPQQAHLPPVDFKMAVRSSYVNNLRPVFSKPELLVDISSGNVSFVMLFTSLLCDVINAVRFCR